VIHHVHLRLEDTAPIEAYSSWREPAYTPTATAFSSPQSRSGVCPAFLAGTRHYLYRQLSTATD